MKFSYLFEPKRKEGRINCLACQYSSRYSKGGCLNSLKAQYPKNCKAFRKAKLTMRVKAMFRG